MEDVFVGFDFDNTLFPTFVEADFGALWASTLRDAPAGTAAVLDAAVPLRCERTADASQTRLSIARARMASEGWRTAWARGEAPMREVAEVFDLVLRKLMAAGCRVCIVTAGHLDWVAEAVGHLDALASTRWRDRLAFPQQRRGAVDGGRPVVDVLSKSGTPGRALSKLQLFEMAIAGTPKVVYAIGDGDEEMRAAEGLRATRGAVSMVRAIRLTPTTLVAFPSMMRGALELVLAEI